jgi:hypothetical protein
MRGEAGAPEIGGVFQGFLASCGMPDGFMTTH